MWSSDTLYRMHTWIHSALLIAIFELGRENFNSVTALSVKLNLCMWIFITSSFEMGMLSPRKSFPREYQSLNDVCKIKCNNVFYEQNVDSFSLHLWYLFIRVKPQSSRLWFSSLWNNIIFSEKSTLEISNRQRNWGLRRETSNSGSWSKLSEVIKENSCNFSGVSLKMTGLRETYRDET